MRSGYNNLFNKVLYSLTLYKQRNLIELFLLQ